MFHKFEVIIKNMYLSSLLTLFSNVLVYHPPNIYVVKICTGPVGMFDI